MLLMLLLLTPSSLIACTLGWDKIRKQKRQQWSGRFLHTQSEPQLAFLQLERLPGLAQSSLLLVLMCGIQAADAREEKRMNGGYFPVVWSSVCLILNDFSDFKCFSGESHSEVCLFYLM